MFLSLNTSSNRLTLRNATATSKMFRLRLVSTLHLPLEHAQQEVRPSPIETIDSVEVPQERPPDPGGQNVAAPGTNPFDANTGSPTTPETSVTVLAKKSVSQIYVVRKSVTCTRQYIARVQEYGPKLQSLRLHRLAGLPRLPTTSTLRLSEMCPSTCHL